MIDGSPTSLFAVTFVAGKAFGKTWRTMLRLALVTVKEEIVTVPSMLAKRILNQLLHQIALTPRLIFQNYRSAITISTTNVAHDGRPSCCSAFTRLLPRRQDCALVAVAGRSRKVKLRAYICGMNDK